MPENEAHDFTETSRRLERYYAASPDPTFAARLEAQLARQAKQTTMTHHPSNPRFNLARFARWGLGLAALAGLVFIIALSVRVLPRGSAPAATANAATDTATPWASQTPLPGVLPTETATPPGPTPPIPTDYLTPTTDLATPGPIAPIVAAALAPQRLAPGICPEASPTPGDLPHFMQKPSRLLGGGEFKQDGFTFQLHLACIPAFTDNTYDWSLYSEFEQLGLYYSWNYQGPSQTGEVLIYSGFEPFVRLSGSTGPGLQDGSSDQGQVGINFPIGIFPNLSGQTVSLRYQLKLQSPDGQWHGVGLHFVMQPEADGYRPVDVAAGLLSPEDLAQAVSEGAPAAPFPTLEPAAVHPLLGEIAGLNARWENTLLSGAGWLHLVSSIDRSQPGGSLPNGSQISPHSTSDGWYLLDEQGRSLAWIARELDESGQPTQISVMKDGVSANLTLGEVTRVGSPQRTGLDFGFYNVASWSVKIGEPLRKEALQMTGEQGSYPAVRYTVEHSNSRLELVYNAETGQAVSSTSYQREQDGQEMSLTDQLTVLTAERVGAPPDDILALLDQQPAPYQPLPPVGEPAPQGFNPSQSPLGVKLVAGDNAITPSFWFGDLYALNQTDSSAGIINAETAQVSGYLLGRIDFGQVAGGWCDRSADGSRLAINYVLPDNLTGSRSWLHWVDLRDVNNVHFPLPELNLVSPPTWAPQGYRVAFSACHEHDECGVYVLEEDGTGTLISSRVSSSIPPLWKPDGTQVAVMVPSEAGDPAGIAVIDIATRTIIMYTGADVSAVKDWGVSFLESMQAFERCSMP